MRIIIVGAGAVGSYLAERFSIEGHDVVVIESDAERVHQLESQLDAMVIMGNGASAATLEQAGLQEADLLVAVSSSDAVNVLACNAATKLGIPITVARVEDPELKAEVEALGVNLVIDPGAAAARELMVLVGTGRVAELIEFADGGLVLVGAYIARESPVVGRSLAGLREMVTEWDWLVVAVVRDGETFIARGDTELHAGDHVLMMAEAGHTKTPFSLLGLSDRPAEKVVILGGTRLAQMTATLLSRRGVATTLIDEDPERCRAIAEALPNVVVVCANPVDPKILAAEGVGNADEVLALTGWDGDNLLGSAVARALGAGEVTARFNDTELAGLLGGAGVDATVSPKLSAANEILRFVRRGKIYSAVTVPGSDAEAIELEVGPASPAVGKTLRELKLPKTLIIGGMQRDGEAFVPRGDTTVRVGDHLIAVALPGGISAAEKLSG
jgi:trk/ktr system potassium uptake protein